MAFSTTGFKIFTLRPQTSFTSSTQFIRINPPTSVLVTEQKGLKKNLRSKGFLFMRRSPYPALWPQALSHIGIPIIRIIKDLHSNYIKELHAVLPAHKLFSFIRTI